MSDIEKLAQLKQIDQTCDEFEADWQAGREPNIDHYLAELTEPARSTAFRELLLIEWQMLQSSGVSPNLDDYRKRYASDEQLVEAAYAQFQEPTSAFTEGVDTDAAYAAIDTVVEKEHPSSIGDYRVLGRIGGGGMGTVYRAMDEKLHRDVAIKVIRPELAASQEARERFLREARAAASIRHDHVVTVFHVGEFQQQPFLVTELLEGESLGVRIKRHEKISEGDALRIGREIADGLAAAHSRDICHRDIKLENIWLETGRDRVKILDFGLARVMEGTADLTSSGMAVGTPRYMSPEQAQGEQADHRSDLFSLGAILYHLVTGRSPFGGRNVTATLMAVTHEEPVPVQALAPDVSPEFANLIETLLRKKPEDRLQSAQAVVENIRSITNKRKASPEATPELSRPAVSRSRTVFPLAIAAAAVIGMIAVAVIYRIATDNGTLIVELDKDGMVALTSDGLVIEDLKSRRTWTVKPAEAETLPSGEYRMKEPGDQSLKFLVTDGSGVEFEATEFTIRRGDKVRVRVTMEPSVVAGNDDGGPRTDRDRPVDAPALAAFPPDDYDFASERRIAIQLLEGGGAVNYKTRYRPVKWCVDARKMPDEPFTVDIAYLPFDGTFDWQFVVNEIPRLKRLRWLNAVKQPPSDDQWTELIHRLAAMRKLEILELEYAPENLAAFEPLVGHRTLTQLRFDPQHTVPPAEISAFRERMKPCFVAVTNDERTALKLVRAGASVTVQLNNGTRVRAWRPQDLPRELFELREVSSVLRPRLLEDPTQMRWLSGIRSLEKIDLRYNAFFTDRHLRCLLPLKNVRKLDIRQTGITEAGFERLKNELEHCDVLWEARDYDLERALATKILRAGGRVNCHLTTHPPDAEVHCESVDDLPSKPFVVVRASPGSEIGIEGIRELTQLTQLDQISFPRCLAMQLYPDETIRLLSGLPYLRILKILLGNVSVSSLHPLTAHPHLRHLHIWGTPAARQDLAALRRRMPDCAIIATPDETTAARVASFAGGRVTIECRDGQREQFDRLENFQPRDSFFPPGGFKLREIRIAEGLYVIEGDQHWLPKVPNVELVDLNDHATVTDKHIPWILNYDQMTKLDIRGTRITDAGYEQLKEALPQCEILWDENGKAEEEPNNNQPTEKGKSASSSSPSDWQSLFRDELLSGWAPRHDSANNQWALEEPGTIRCFSKLGNNYLVSPRIYRDFEFEFEANAASSDRSGLVFRASKRPSGSFDVYHQLYIQPNASGRGTLTGTIKRHGTGYAPYLQTDEQQQLLHQNYNRAGHWYAFRIVARGGTLTVSIRDAETEDEFTEVFRTEGAKPLEGYLAFLVENRESQIRFRNVRIRELTTE